MSDTPDEYRLRLGSMVDAVFFPTSGLDTPWEKATPEYQEHLSAVGVAVAVAAQVGDDLLQQIEQQFEPGLVNWFRSWASDRGIPITPAENAQSSPDEQ